MSDFGGGYGGGRGGGRGGYRSGGGGIEYFLLTRNVACMKYDQMKIKIIPCVSNKK